MRQAFNGCATADRLYSLTRIRSRRGPGDSTGSTPNNRWWYTRTLSPAVPPTTHTDPFAPSRTATLSRRRAGPGGVRTKSIPANIPHDALGTVYNLQLR